MEGGFQSEQNGSGRGRGSFMPDRKRHRPRSPSSQSYQRPKFDPSIDNQQSSDYYYGQANYGSYPPGSSEGQNPPGPPEGNYYQGPEGPYPPGPEGAYPPGPEGAYAPGPEGPFPPGPVDGPYPPGPSDRPYQHGPPEESYPPAYQTGFSNPPDSFNQDYSQNMDSYPYDDNNYLHEQPPDFYNQDQGSQDFYQGNDYGRYPRSQNASRFRGRRTGRGGRFRGDNFRGNGNSRGTRGRGRGDGFQRGGFSERGNRGGDNQRRGFNRGRGSRGSRRPGRGNESNRGGSYQFQPEKKGLHSLSKKTTVDTTNMSIVEKFKRFAIFLQTFPERENAILTLENALIASKLLLESNYESSVLLLYSGRPMFTGCLMIGGQYIVRAVGPTKKELKHDVYTQALHILKTDSVHAIFARVDQPEDMKKKILDNLQQDTPPEGESKEKDTPLKETSRLPSQKFSVVVPALIKSLKSLLPAPNSISALEQAITMSHAPLKTNCLYEEGKTPDAKSYFRVSLCMDAILISMGFGAKKKLAKHDAYENAITALTTRTMESLESGVDVEGSKSEKNWETMKIIPLPDFENLKTQEKSKKKTPKKAPVTKPSPEVMFDMLITELKNYSFQEVNVNNIDCLAVKLGLSPVCIYKTLSSEGGDVGIVSCTLYIDHFLIASCESMNKKEAQIETYQRAYEFLIASSGSVIASEQPKMPEMGPADTDVLEVVHKGIGKCGDSNIDRLKILHFDPTKDSKSVEDLIILEQCDWSKERERHTFAILIQSATSCGILMEWNISTIQETPYVFQCSLFLQKKEVASATEKTKNGARNKACAIALSNFYKTQPVILIDRKSEPTKIISWEEINQIVEDAKSTSAPDTEKEGEEDEGETDHSLDHCISILKEQAESDCLETIVVAYGAPNDLIRKLRAKTFKLKLKLKSDYFWRDGKQGLAVTRRLPPPDMVKCLESKGFKNGRYHLLKSDEKPTLDIQETEILLKNADFTQDYC